VTASAVRTALRRHFDLDAEAEALLLDLLTTMPADELIRRAVLQAVADPSVDVREVGVKLAPSDYRVEAHTHVSVLRFAPALRCPPDPHPPRRPYA
jgi:hypothetical protein